MTDMDDINSQALKLSEAIRLGAMLRPQCFGRIRSTIQIRTGFLGLLKKSVDATCALGAAFEAGGCREVPNDSNSLNTRPGPQSSMSILIPVHWHAVLIAQYRCPICDLMQSGVLTISHLNDVHRWTREQIADWVGEIENRVLRDSAGKESTERSELELAAV